MATNKNDRKQSDIPGCDEPDNETQQKINALKKTYCLNSTDAQNSIETLKISFQATEEIYKRAERRYLSTRDNYMRYVNTEISMGCQLKQANEKMKTSVASYKTWDASLALALTPIFTAIKDVKTKMTDLRDAATKLEHSMHDSCSTSQWSIITGKEYNNCKDENKPEEIECCKDVDEVIKLLFCMPKALWHDADSLFKSSSEIIGIQKFVNAGSLVTLQQTLYDNAKKFDDFLKATITSRQKDLDSQQNDLATGLTAALCNRTSAVMDLYAQRCNYSGIHSTLETICCPECNCVEDDSDDCKRRLDKCACEICDICGELKNAFTNTPPANNATATT